MSYKALAKKAVLALISEIDYDIWKQYSDPSDSEDPEFIEDHMNTMVTMMESMFEEAASQKTILNNER